jgi:putative ABC transport system permease protein
MTASELVQDVRYAIRGLLRRPAMTAALVLTLTLALGASTAVFSVVDAVLWRPLPFAHPEHLVALWEANPGEGLDKTRVAAFNYQQWRAGSSAFSSMALFGSSTATLTGAGEPRQLQGARVTSEFFSLLGVEATVGRLFQPEDYRPAAPTVVVLSNALWRSLFGGDRRVVGAVVHLDGRPCTIVGVLPPQLLPLEATAAAHGRLEMGTGERYWLPLAPVKAEAEHAHVFGVFARLRAAVTLRQAQNQLQAIAARLGRELPATNKGSQVKVVPLIDEAVGSLRMALWALVGAVAMVLAIACANVASLMLVRASGKRRELALRAALGAGRLRLLRQFLIEGLLLAVTGTALGTALSLGLVRLLPAISPGDLPRLAEAAVDWRTLLATLALCGATGLAITAAPLSEVKRHDLEAALREGGRAAGQGSRSLRLRELLVVAEVALAVTLVIGSGLLIRSFRRLASVDPGFRAERILAFDLAHPARRYQDMSRLDAFYDELLRELGSLPGVAATGAAYDRPLATSWFQGFRIAEAPPPEPGKGPVAAFQTVTPGYFTTLGIELLAGRRFTDADDARAPGAVIVNRALADKFFSGRDPLGRRLEITTTQWQWGDVIPKVFTVVGVVGNVKSAGLADAAEPVFYLPFLQTPQFNMTVFVRTRQEPHALLPAIRERLRRLDPELPMTGIASVAEIVDSAVARPRWNAAALAAFAAISLLLAGVGVWGVLAGHVRLRAKEIGIRIALGADRRRLFRWIVGYGLRPVLLGLVAGTIGALALGHVAASLLYGVRSTDPVTYALVTGGLLVIALLTCAVPSAAAARTDPIATLREE